MADWLGVDVISLPLHHCTRCDVDLPTSEFGKNSRSPSGLKSWCRPCTNSYDRERKASNPDARDAARAAVRKWRLSHPEYHRAEARAYYYRNIEVVKARRAAWRARNADTIRAVGAEYRSRPGNTEIARARTATWQAANPAWHRELMRSVQAARRARLRDALVVPFTLQQLQARMAFFGFKCWMCGGAFDHVDHVKPIKRGGPHVLANLRPACAFCNVSKSAKWFGVAELSRFVVA